MAIIQMRSARIGLFSPFSMALVLVLADIACTEDKELTGDAGSDADTDTDSDSDTDSDHGADAGYDGGGDFEIDPERILEDIAFLADDALEGREAGTAGNQAALEFIAAAFGDIGIEPAGDDGTYYDAFTYPEWRELQAPLLVIDGEAAVAGIDYDVLRYSPSGQGEGGMVFAGYGIVVSPFDQAEYPDCPYPFEGYSDFEGLDLAGNAVLRFGGLPNGDTGLGALCPLEDGTAYAADAGATALITVRDYLWPYDELAAGVTLNWSAEYPLPVLIIARTLAEELLPDLHDRFIALSDYASASVATEHTVEVSVETEVADNEISNVLGVVPGTDPELSLEVVLIGGHMDHVGRELGSDAIYNGADDNASGTAVTIEIARAVAAMEGGPKRTVVFAAWNAEESGLFGSCAYSDSPHYPLEKTTAVLNLDAVGAGNGAGAYLIGGLDSQNEWFSSLMNESATADGVAHTLIPTEYVDSSDHSCFYEAGVAAVTMQTLGNRAETHTQYDDVDTINLKDIEKAALLSWAAIRPLAAGTESDFE